MSAWDVIGGAVVGGLLGGVPGAIAGGAAAASSPGQKAIGAVGGAAKDVSRWTVSTAEHGVKIIEDGATVVVDAVGDAIASAYNVLRGVVGFRDLRPSELQRARAVFKHLLPLDRVVISSLIGAGGKPFVIPGSMLLAGGAQLAAMVPGLATVMTITWFVRGLQNKFVFFLGEDGYNHPLNYSQDKTRMSLQGVSQVTRRPGSSFAHELTHLWQGHYTGFGWNYVVDSVTKRCECMFTGESQYGAGTDVANHKQWRDFGVEQQARVVECWYIANFDRYQRGLPPEPGIQPYHDYMVSNVWTANNKATTVFTPPTAPSALSFQPASILSTLPMSEFQRLKNVSATAAGLEAQAKAVEMQARGMIASGNPILVAQGQAMLAQSQALLAQSKAMLSGVGRVSLGFKTSGLNKV